MKKTVSEGGYRTRILCVGLMFTVFTTGRVVHAGGSTWAVHEIPRPWTAPGSTESLGHPVSVGPEGFRLTGNGLVLGDETCLAVTEEGIRYGVRNGDALVWLATFDLRGREASGNGRLTDAFLRRPGPERIELDFVIQTRDDARRATLRMEAGRPLVVEAGDATQALGVSADMEYLLMPVFLGEDFVFVPGEYPAGPIRMPLDRLHLMLLDGGAGMLQLILPGKTQSVEIMIDRTEGRARVEDARILFGGEPIYLAVRHSDNLWFTASVDTLFEGGSEADQETDVELAWAPPFDDEWRLTYHSSEGRATTWRHWNARRRAEIAHGIGREYTYIWPFWIRHGKAHACPPPSRVHSVDPERAFIYSVPLEPIRAALGDAADRLFPEGFEQRMQPFPFGELCVIRAHYNIHAAAQHGNPRPSAFLHALNDHFLDEAVRQYERLLHYQAFGEHLIQACQTFAETRPGVGDEVLDRLRSLGTELLRSCDRSLSQYEPRRAGWVGFNPDTSDPGEIMVALHAEHKRALSSAHPESIQERQDLAQKMHRVGTTTQGFLFRPRLLTFTLHYQTWIDSVRHPEMRPFLRAVRADITRMMQDKHWTERHR